MVVMVLQISPMVMGALAAALAVAKVMALAAVAVVIKGVTVEYMMAVVKQAVNTEQVVMAME